MSKIALADMVEELRIELEGAAARATGEGIRFELGEVTLEAEVAVSVEAEAKGGVKFWIFTEASAKAGRTKTHKVTLKLLPFDTRAPSPTTKPKPKGRVQLKRR